MKISFNHTSPRVITLKVEFFSVIFCYLDVKLSESFFYVKRFYAVLFFFYVNLKRLPFSTSYVLENLGALTRTRGNNKLLDYIFYKIGQVLSQLLFNFSTKAPGICSYKVFKNTNFQLSKSKYGFPKFMGLLIDEESGNVLFFKTYLSTTVLPVLAGLFHFFFQ